jgi:hypothetical protein
MSSVATVEFSGQVLGAQGSALELLDAKLGDADVMIIKLCPPDAHRLHGGGPLRELGDQPAVSEGRQVQFVEGAPPGRRVLQRHRHQRARAHRHPDRLSLPPVRRLR